MDLMVVSKILFIAVVTLPNGSYESKAEQVNECPPYDVVHTMMNYRIKTGEITSWFADCSEYPFYEISKTPA
jgi:hypothetical protein|tara:strand:- start:660 stop:875 length:216 start_codon:yes stop_codon:yes gene_type:complete